MKTVLRIRGEVDDDALLALCRSEFPRLIGLVALHVGDRTVAEEIAQDALAEFIRCQARVELPGPWLTRVALNISNSWLRRRAAERRALTRHGRPGDVHHDPDSVDIVQVRQALAQLPRRQRMAVVLRFYEQYSVAETAEFMGCAQGTVKALTHRAMTRLRATADVFEEVTDHAGL